MQSPPPAGRPAASLLAGITAFRREALAHVPTEGEAEEQGSPAPRPRLAGSGPALEDAEKRVGAAAGPPPGRPVAAAALMAGISGFKRDALSPVGARTATPPRAAGAAGAGTPNPKPGQEAQGGGAGGSGAKGKPPLPPPPRGGGLDFAQLQLVAARLAAKRNLIHEESGDEDSSDDEEWKK